MTPISDAQNFGLIRRGTGHAVLEPIPLPKLRDDYILVRTVTIALNPTDWTTLDATGDDGTIVGCDYAGYVEEIGPAVKKRFQKGDRVAGFGHGGNDAHPDSGAFARYIAVKGDIQFHIPKDVSFEAACTVGAGIITNGLGLYDALQLPWPEWPSRPSTHGKPILVYGGSTASGSLAIQFAKLSGMTVITTCSPKHFDWVKQLGADQVFDYRIPQVGAHIRAATHEQIDKAFDTVGLESSAAICAEAIGPDGGTYCGLLEASCPRPDVTSHFFLGYGVSGESYVFEGEHFDARPQDFKFACRWVPVAEKLWAHGGLQPHPQRVGAHGLLGAIDGMQQMREGRYRGEKLVYRVSETAWPSR